MARAPVRLNVYDMYWLNDYASNIGIGVYHSGVEVYGVEYAYGGHPFPFSGVFENSPQDAEELGENFKFKESIDLGETDFSAAEIRRMIQLLGQEYRGDKYHLINKNCNHFSASFAKTLTGVEIPGWVNRLASISNSIPFLERWIPQEWLTPVALQQSLEEKGQRSLENNASRAAPGTLNYPVLIDDAQDALDVCGSPASSRRNERANGDLANGTATTTSNGTSNGTGATQNWLQRFQRRGSSSSLPQSAPSTSRVQSPTPLARLWNSIKSLGNEDGDVAGSPSTTSANAPTVPLSGR
ncbi:hypothetical protein AAVH_22913 [Aphelenchoides avenae]|nr:hypothetical protein AAVH_22913 [Aphelenchus avenae]